MTNEEAIKYLRQIYPNGGHCWLDSQRIEAIEMAISALSQPSLPYNLDEAANRQAALEQPYKWEEEQDGSFGVTPLFVMSNIRSAFKAGAEWMAGQGITLEGRASRKYENGLAGFVSWILFDQQKAAHLLVNQGEEADVIINIRKK